MASRELNCPKPDKSRWSSGLSSSLLRLADLTPPSRPPRHLIQRPTASLRISITRWLRFNLLQHAKFSKGEVVAKIVLDEAVIKIDRTGSSYNRRHHVYACIMETFMGNNKL